jgi:uncharacterized membrane protein YkvA (DUF1232 family)
MSEPNKYLDTFPEWLRNLGEDAASLSQVVGNTELPEAYRRYAAAGLNYLFKSLDLIPDGIEDLGYLDDAFVVRVAAELALAEAPEGREDVPKLVELGAQAALIQELLGADYARLTDYVSKLQHSTARGRSVDEILGDDGVRRDFLNEVDGWVTSYEAPTFSKDEKNLVKLKSFLSAKLP